MHCNPGVDGGTVSPDDGALVVAPPASATGLPTNNKDAGDAVKATIPKGDMATWTKMAKGVVTTSKQADAQQARRPASAVSSAPSSTITTSATKAMPATGSAGETQSQTTTTTSTSIMTPASSLAPWPVPVDLLFRTGEMVWYQIARNWRIGLIAGACTHPNYPNQRAYEIVPLGHASAPAPNVAKLVAEMRPYHAFTVPGATIADFRPLGFDGVPWQAYIANHPAQRDVIILDASKLGAARINTSHSLFSQLDDGCGSTTRYGGMFLGPERIEVGDVVRVQHPSTPSDNDPNTLLGIRDIFTTLSNPDTIYVRGSEFVIAPMANNTTAASVVPLNKLPLALREEITWRERIRQLHAPSQQNQPQGTRYVALLSQADVVHREPTIRGRWYPANQLLPISKPDSYQAALQHGRLDDVVTYLNSRTDSMQQQQQQQLSQGLGQQQYVGRTKSRLEAAGQAVPEGRQFRFEPNVRE